MAGRLHFENVGLRHGTGAEILADMDLVVGLGELAVITGPGGAGKTALLALAALTIAPSRGSMRLFDADVLAMPRRALPVLRRRIGAVGAFVPLIPALSVRENIALPLRIAGVAAGERDGRVDELLGWIGLRGTARPDDLGDGARRWVALARAIVARPDLLIADEPLPDPDPAGARRLLALFERLTSLGTAILFATRDERFAASLPAAHRLRLTHGRLIPVPAPRAVERA